MSERRMQDPEYLKTVAYRDASNLDARIAFWQRYGTSGEAWCDRFFDRIDAPPNAHVLELGCGPADIWRIGIARGLVPAGWDVTLTDLSQGMVDEASARLSGLAREFEYRVVDATDIPYPDGAFDVVFANYMLYHVPNVEQVLSEIWRVLKPGGRLLAATNSDRHIREIIELQKRFASDPSVAEDIRPAHLTFSLESGPPIVAKYFDDVKVSFDESPALSDDPDLLMGFLTSTDVRMDVDALRSHVVERIRRDGQIVITRASGLITAEKPASSARHGERTGA